MRKFFVSQESIDAEAGVIVIRDDASHIVKALRMGKGERLLVSDGSGEVYECEITGASSDAVEVRILDSRACEADMPVAVTLFQALPKGQKLDIIIQKSIELGVNTIVPVVTARVVPEMKGDAPQKKLSRWRRIAAETVKQCGRDVIPEVHEPVSLEEAAVIACSAGNVLLPYEGESGRTLKDALSVMTVEEGGSLAFFVGPEGGFSEEEVCLLTEKAGAVTVSLGRSILRTETAGPAVAAMLRYALAL